MLKLYPYQERGINFHLTHNYSLNLCKMGSGKTIMALEAARRVGLSTLIICPSYLKSNWVREIENNCPDLNYKIGTYTMLSNNKCLPSADIIIADEVHYLKNVDTNRTLAFRQYILSNRPKYFIGLTGTPIQNRVIEYFSLLQIIGYNPSDNSGININKYFSSIEKFGDRYCYKKPKTYAGKSQLAYYGLRANKKDELRQILNDKVFLVGDKELDHSLPTLNHKTFYINDHNKLQHMYQDFMEGKTLSADKSQSALRKVEYTIKYASDLLNETDKIVIFTDHIEPAVKIAAYFRVTPIMGSVSNDKRDSIFKDFSTNPNTKVLVATIGSFSLGVNITCAHHLIFNDVSWIPSNNLQAIKRIHRIGQKEHCLIHYMIMGDTDNIILNLLKDKLKEINTTNAIAKEVNGAI